MNNLARLDCFRFWKENKLCRLKEIVLTNFRRVFRICLFSVNNPCHLYLSRFSISHRDNKEICCNLNKYNNNTTTTTSTFFSFLPQVQHPDQDLDSLLQKPHGLSHWLLEKPQLQLYNQVEVLVLVLCLLPSFPLAVLLKHFLSPSTAGLLQLPRRLPCGGLSQVAEPIHHHLQNTVLLEHQQQQQWQWQR